MPKRLCLRLDRLPETMSFCSCDTSRLYYLSHGNSLKCWTSPSFTFVSPTQSHHLSFNIHVPKKLLFQLTQTLRSSYTSILLESELRLPPQPAITHIAIMGDDPVNEPFRSKYK